MEVLDHSPEAMDLSRLNDIGCVLFNHNRDAVIAKILRAWGENSRGCAEIEFDGDEESQIIYDKVKSGTLRGVSVGYSVDSWEEVAPGKMSADGRFMGPISIARKWTPLEISIVSIPADASVGVGRDFEEMEEKSLDDEKETTRNQGGEQRDEKAAAMPENPEQIADMAVREERARIAGITALCRSFEMDPSGYIIKGITLADAQAAVLEELQRTHKPVSTSVAVDEKDKFRAAASDALLMRGGMKVEKPAPGAMELRALSLRDMAIETLSMEGVSGARRMDNDLLMRQFFNPTSVFPSIMDDAIQKAYVQGYNLVPTTFQSWTTKGTLKDFKETRDHNYLAGPAGEFLLIPEGGEMKHDLPADTMLPQRRLQTYGRQFTMTREAFINDDIGFLTTLPSRYAASAKLTINNQVYAVLVKNPIIYDGKPLFDNSHNNLLKTGTGLSAAAVKSMILSMKRQKDPFNQPMIVNPRIMIVPVGWEFDIKVLFGSPTINTPDNTQAVNPLYNFGFTVIEDPAMDAQIPEGQPLPWFMVSDNNVRGTIQVDYLNGQEMPTIRRMERPGQLGFIWDIYLDWGVNVVDFRGLIKNPGVVPAE